MLKFVGINGSGLFDLPEAVKAVMNSEYGVPADDMTVTFPRTIPLLWRILAVDENGDVLFEGLADEQVENVSANGVTVTVYARSPAALPLDNECEPADYYYPSIDIIFEKHLRQFGIKLDEDSECLSEGCGEMNIGRGVSHYGAVKRFCSAFLGAVPRISRTGVFYPNGRREGLIVFGDGGIPISTLSRRSRRYGKLSSVIAIDGDSTIIVRDSDAEAQGILCERRMYLSDSRTGFLCDADDMLAASKRGCELLDISSPEAVGDIVGCSASVAFDGSNESGYTVVKTRCVYSADGEQSFVRLEKL